MTSTRVFPWIIVLSTVAPVATRAGPIHPSGNIFFGELSRRVARESNSQLTDTLTAAIESFGRRDFERSADLFNQIQTRLPHLPPGPLIVAKALLRSGSIREGRAFLERAAAEYPGHPDVYLSFGELAIADGRISDASLNFEKAAALAPPTGWSQQQITAFHGLCLRGRSSVAERRRDWRAAEQHLLAWTKLDGKSGDAWRRLARVRCQLGKEDDAVDALRTAQKASGSPEFPEVALAALYADQRNADKTSEWLHQAIKRYPDHAVPYIQFAEWLLTVGETRQAAEFAERADRLSGDNGQLSLLRGLIAQQMGNHLEAERLFEELHRQSPANIEVSNQFVLVLAEQNDSTKLQRASELAQLNARLYPRNAEVLVTLGRVMYLLDKVDDAEKVFRAVASTGHLSADAAYFFAVILVAQEKTDEATAVLTPKLVAAPGRFIHRSAAKRLVSQLADNSRQPASADRRREQ